MGIDVLRVEWTAISDATVARLIGPVDLEGADVLAGVALVAKETDRVVIDLSNVTDADEGGIELLEALSRMPNVGVVHVSTAVALMMEKLGRLGF